MKQTAMVQSLCTPAEVGVIVHTVTRLILTHFRQWIGHKRTYCINKADSHIACRDHANLLKATAQ